ncbi:MAG: hypothetical protein KGM16_07590 [Bacteroidota bacterium]|nr:hypothetical protein [Bacteroidota bacterium]
MAFIDIAYKVLIPLIAACVGAILAFRYQRTTELKRDKRFIIQSLMMYRNVGVQELDWIKALNAIDIVFHNDKKVRELYHSFLAQTTVPLYSNGQWVETFNKMLHETTLCTEYSNVSIHDIRDFYAPNILELHYPNMNKESKPPKTSEDDVPQTNS